MKVREAVERLLKEDQDAELELCDGMNDYTVKSITPVSGDPDPHMVTIVAGDFLCDHANSRVCEAMAWPYTENNMCVLKPGHGPDHKDARGRTFTSAGYPR